MRPFTNSYNRLMARQCLECADDAARRAAAYRVRFAGLQLRLRKIVSFNVGVLMAGVTYYTLAQAGYLLELVEPVTWALLLVLVAGVLSLKWGGPAQLRVYELAATEYGCLHLHFNRLAAGGYLDLDAQSQQVVLEQTTLRYQAQRRQDIWHSLSEKELGAITD